MFESQIVKNLGIIFTGSSSPEFVDKVLARRDLLGDISACGELSEGWK